MNECNWIDRSTFSFSTPCFRMEGVYNDRTTGHKYRIFFYISVISEYYAYKIKIVYNNEIDGNTLLENMDDALLKQARELFGPENQFTDLDKKNEKLKILLRQALLKYGRQKYARYKKSGLHQ